MDDHYDRIGASIPVNRTAAMQTAKGETWSPRVKILDHYIDRPKTVRIPPQSRANQEFIDFTGMRFGGLEVVGIMRKTNRNRPASWACRCACGAYCTRTAKSLKVAQRGGNSFNDRCGLCNYQRKLRDGLLRGMRNYSNPAPAGSLAGAFPADCPLRNSPAASVVGAFSEGE